MEKKIVFFDVDGTLVSAQQKPSLKVVAAIQQLRKNGHLAFICTGRNKCMLEKELLEIGFDGYICSAGSYIEMNNEVLESKHIAYEKVKEIAQIFDHNNVAYSLEATDVTFADDALIKMFAVVPEHFDNSEMERLYKEIETNINRKTITEFYQNPLPIHKISFIANTYEDLEEPRKHLSKDYIFIIHEIFSKNTVNGEIIDRNITKATAIEKIIKKLNIDIKNTVAFGDSMNDYEMIQLVNQGIVMEDGAKALLNIADDTCLSVHQDGVYEGLKKLKLI